MFIMKTLEHIMDFIARNILKVVFSIIFIAAVFIKAMYSFDDSPYFTSHNLYDVIMGVLAVSLFAVIVRYRDWLQEHINYRLCFLLFAVFSIAYIILVPLTPFSDMAAVYRGAVHFSRFEFAELFADEYWNVFPGNILLAVFWGILLIPFPKSLITVKIINAVLTYAIIAITRNLAKEYNVRYYNLVYVLMLTFMPLFLYMNHVYFDLPVILICMSSIYLFVKGKNIILIFAILGIGKYIRTSVSIVMLAILFIYIFDKISAANKKYAIRHAAALIAALSVFAALGYGLPKLVYSACYGSSDIKSYSGWNQIYIGLNENEFGFMDNDFSYDRSFGDIVNRVKTYGPVRLAKIITKKTFWLWSQGTYQAERYAFGADAGNVFDKFEYETILTKYLLNSEQKLRKLINAFMRAQYLILFLLMTLTFWTEDDIEKYRLFYYIIFATFAIMLVYELKSRYILQLCPLMVILAVRRIEKVNIE